MTNILEGMKAVYFDKVWDIETVYLRENLLFNEEIGVILRSDGECINVKSDPWKPLLKFPDKDSKGSECWSGDIIKSKDKLLLIRHTKYGWRYFTYDKEEGFSEYGMEVNETVGHLIGRYYTRLCSIYDDKAKESLPEETIDKLKEERK